MSAPDLYARYAEQAGSVAQAMLLEPDNTPVTFDKAMPGSLELFRWAGRYAHLQTARRLGDSAPGIAKNANVLFGMLNISRFVYMSATYARDRRLDARRYYSALTHPATFTQTLGAIASRDGRVSWELESRYGLLHGSDPKEARRYYRVNADGSIGLRNMDGLAAQYRRELEADGEVIRDKAMCAAHRSGSLEGIYDALVPLYAEHPMLGGAIFAETTPVTRIPAAFAATQNG